MADDTQRSYDSVAENYADRFCDEMDAKPFDRKMLDGIMEKVEGLGIICDMGCCPSQVARYLHRQGVNVCGVDLSQEMIRHAQNLNPEISFQQGDILALDHIADNSFGGIVAFYSIIYIPRDQSVQALRELKRVLRPKGVLLLTFHVGQQTKHLDGWWGKTVNVDFYFFEMEEMKGDLTEAGFELEEVIERDPYPEAVEHQSRRTYIFASFRNITRA